MTTCDDRVADFAAATLTADVRDFFLDRLRHLDTPWRKLPEGRQREIAAEAHEAAERVVRKVVQIVATHANNAVIDATLEKVDVTGKGMKATLTFNKLNPHRHAVVDAQGDIVLLIVKDSSEIDTDTRPAEVDLDQPSMFGQEPPQEPAGGDRPQDPGEGESDAGEPLEDQGAGEPNEASAVETGAAELEIVGRPQDDDGLQLPDFLDRRNQGALELSLYDTDGDTLNVYHTPEAYEAAFLDRLGQCTDAEEAEALTHANRRTVSALYDMGCGDVTQRMMERVTATKRSLAGEPGQPEPQVSRRRRKRTPAASGAEAAAS